MAIVNESLVKFGYSVGADASTTAGFITFDSSRQAIYVGDGTEAKLVTPSVKNVNFDSVTKVLTIVKLDGSEQKLDFSDVASAGQTTKILGALRTDVETLKENVGANATAIENLSNKVTNLDTSYKAADTEIRKEFAAADNAINDKIGTVAEGKTVVGLIEETKSAASAAHSVVAEDSSFLTIETSRNESTGAVTYTLKTTNVASATDLVDVSVIANTAATQVDFNTHKNNNDIHITADERSKWNAAKSAIDTFLADADMTSNAVDTLKELQAYMTADASAAAKMVQDIADVSIRAEKGISDAAAAQAAANQAQGEVDALETVVAGVKATADAAAVKTTTDTSLALKADASTVYTKSETYTKTEVNGLVAGANTNASTAESNAKKYADAIKVNGQAQSGQNITVSGLNILVGGTGNHKDASLSTTVEDLYSKVDAASKAGVQSLAVNTDSSNYANVDKSTDAVTLTIKKVALADASNGKTGVADAWDVKESIRVAKEGAISTVQGIESDASTAATVVGAKKYAKEYADDQIEANALRWTVL